jgi:hypothetical protein
MLGKRQTAGLQDEYSVLVRGVSREKVLCEDSGE